MKGMKHYPCDYKVSKNAWESGCFILKENGLQKQINSAAS
jgi:hypothetical protein